MIYQFIVQVRVDTSIEMFRRFDDYNDSQSFDIKAIDDDLSGYQND